MTIYSSKTHLSDKINYLLGRYIFVDTQYSGFVKIQIGFHDGLKENEHALLAAIFNCKVSVRKYKYLHIYYEEGKTDEGARFIEA